MPAYWSHFVSHVSTQRARWSRATPSSNRTDDQMNSSNSIDAASPVSENPLERENESLKREIAELSDQVDELRQLLSSRAEQIQVLVAGMRHLRVQRRRWSSLSSVDSVPEDPSRLVNVDDMNSSSSGDGDNASDLSASFDFWLESDEEEKDEDEPRLIPVPSPQLKAETIEIVVLADQQSSLVKRQTL